MSRIVKLVFKKEFLRDRRKRRIKSTVIKTTDKVLETAEILAPGKGGKAAKLLREILQIFSKR